MSTSAMRLRISFILHLLLNSDTFTLCSAISEARDAWVDARALRLGGLTDCIWESDSNTDLKFVLVDFSTTRLVTCNLLGTLELINSIWLVACDSRTSNSDVVALIFLIHLFIFLVNLVLRASSCPLRLDDNSGFSSHVFPPFSNKGEIIEWRLACVYLVILFFNFIASSLVAGRLSIDRFSIYSLSLVSFFSQLLDCISFTCSFRILSSCLKFSWICISTALCISLNWVGGAINKGVRDVYWV